MVQQRADLDIDRKHRTHIPMQPVIKQDVSTRLKSFEEIYLNYETEIVRIEAGRCIQCPDPAPCQMACPLSNDIPTAMRLVEEGEFLAAANVFRQTSPMPEICSRVCPQEKLCEGSCTQNGGVQAQPVRIGKVEKFVSEFQYQVEGIPVGFVSPDTGKAVAIVGAGPSGLAVAEKLRREGHAVTVYDANPYPGGLLIYGIPAFKLSKDRVVKKVEQLQAIGIQFVVNTRIGQDITLERLATDYDAVYLGVGANVEAPSRWEGTDLNGIYKANEYLIRANVPCPLQPDVYDCEKQPPVVGRRVFVIGGGDTAMDCVRTSLRLQDAQGFPLDVTCAYRRTEAEMPGNRTERENAREEGAHFEWLTAPRRFIGDQNGDLMGVEFVRMRLGEPDESGRRRPEEIPDSEYLERCDTVVLALGYWPDPLLSKTNEALKTYNWGLIETDGVGRTSLANVWAGGDAVSGPDLVSTAIRAGLTAAEDIHACLMR
jgi:glutamate synthase (NADPH/NADH) small chain